MYFNRLAYYLSSVNNSDYLVKVFTYIEKNCAELKEMMSSLYILFNSKEKLTSDFVLEVIKFYVKNGYDYIKYLQPSCSFAIYINDNRALIKQLQLIDEKLIKLL